MDLQGNPGGPLSAALDLAAMFLPHGSVLLQISAHNKTMTYKSLNKNADKVTPILILMDGRTASASEIFAAALVDHQRAITAGSRTVGKNVAQVHIYTSQTIYYLLDDQSVIYIQ